MADICKKMCTFALEFIGIVSSHRRKSPKIPSIPKPRNRATHLLVGCRSALDKGVWRYLFEWRGRWSTILMKKTSQIGPMGLKENRQMKTKIFSFIAAAMLSMHAGAQSLTTPEYVGQIGLIKSDSTIVLLKRENSGMGAKSSPTAYIPVVGTFLSKTKSMISLKGATSETVISEPTFSLVLRGENNNQDPTSFICVFTLNVKKKKRELVIGDVSLLSGMNINTKINNVEWEAHRYGKDCYIISFKDMKPGEYGIALGGDLYNITTFSVK